MSNATEEMDRLELQRTRVVCGPDINFNTTSTIAAHQYTAVGTDNRFTLDKFKDNFKIDITRYDDMDMEFEMTGISCAMANSLRRIMIAEVPTMAIEHVYIINNTSIIQDEVLAHRLGLIPIAVDPRLFEYKAKTDPANERNTIVFKLKIECRRNADGSIENESVYSSSLEWLPDGSEIVEETGCNFASTQRDVFPNIEPVHQDILLAKLRPGQAIELECHCIKGVGEEHAKWSPVATTWYRLLPEVALLQQDKLRGELALELAAALPGLIQVEGHGEDARVVKVDDPRQHDKLLEKVRRMSGEDTWRPYIQLRKIKDHFIFTIESTGAWKPHELFNYAVNLMISKCDKVLEGLAQFPEKSYDDDELSE